MRYQVYILLSLIFSLNNVIGEEGSGCGISETDWPAIESIVKHIQYEKQRNGVSGESLNTILAFCGKDPPIEFFKNFKNGEETVFPLNESKHRDDLWDAIFITGINPVEEGIIEVYITQGTGFDSLLLVFDLEVFDGAWKVIGIRRQGDGVFELH